MKLSVDGCFRRSVYMAFAAGFAAAVIPAQAQETAPAAPAQSGDQPVQLEAVRVTGSRVVIPGATSASPIITVRAEEFSLQQTPEVEQVLRNLPSTLASDGSNANNGSGGASTLNLRGLGANRNLILIDGHRVTPYDVNGLVDLSVIPVALLSNADVVTGGASAVYGSDAMSGAVNFIMKRNFQGVDLSYNNGITEKGDGDKTALALTMGTNLAGGKGNVAFSVNYSHRDGVQLGQRSLGLLGIATDTGGGLADFRAGKGPVPATAGCGGPGATGDFNNTAYSSTTLPTRIALFNVPGTARQFRENGTLAGNCSRFNFNPFNYYETPQNRYGGSVFGHFEFNEHVEAYSNFLFSNTSVRQQVAPSGVFGTGFFTPLANPFISDQARGVFIAQGEAARASGSLSNNPNSPGYNWQDRNNNGVVDNGDYLKFLYRRRTVELGERSTTFNTNAYQTLVGLRGNIIGNWNYDISYQRGQSDRTNVNAGYTNLTNIGNALDSVDGKTCANGDPSCVPINLFGGFGAITPEAARYSGATALATENYVQNITNATVNGAVDLVRPFATRPIGLVFGVERRREAGSFTPDECLKLAPNSCLGGAGGNSLPIAGGFHVNEVFTEATVPLIDGKIAAKQLDLDLGYRWSDYNPTGLNKTWKYGLLWKPIDSLLVRVEHERAARAPNVGELASPQTTGLSNAQFDPCSVGNPAAATAKAGDVLFDNCVRTGVAAADVGKVEDIVSNQVNGFFGTDLQKLPKPEKGDTTTVGFAFQPANFGPIRNPYLSLDYYDIKIVDYIGSFGAQEILDGCYTQNRAADCVKIKRIGETLTNDGSGIQLFTTNLKFLRAEGLELTGAFGVNAGSFGKVKFALDGNYYLTQESQSSNANAVIDCKGFYGTQCGNPLPRFRMVQRTTWDINSFEVSALWRHIGNSKVETAQVGNTFSEFQSIKPFNYLDASLSYHFTKKIKASVLATNVFNVDPPVVGGGAADTRSNSGNTFPSVYDVLGRVYSFGVSATF